jgi:hypothetical protein
MMVERYFPEPYRSKVLDNLSEKESFIFRTMTSHRLLPYRDETRLCAERAVFDEWRDKHVPTGSHGKQ